MPTTSPRGVDRYGIPLDPTPEQQDTLDQLAAQHDRVRFRQALGNPACLWVECFDRGTRPGWTAAEYEVGEDGEFVHGIGDAPSLRRAGR